MSFFDALLASTPIITVFASSSPRTPQVYCQEAYRLGQLLAQQGWIVRNGAGADGCMGALTNGALSSGGRVEGVNLQTFVDQGLIHPALKEVQVVEQMRERKRLLGEGCAAFVALPGGPGTWEEIWEVAVERQIGSHQRPLLLCDIRGFWQGFAQMLERAETDGLLYGPRHDLLQIVDGAEATLQGLRALFASTQSARQEEGL